ncbi:MAG: SDR family oxidoreductase [Propionibacteriaceae bacterium]|nr:SDR family oxidoreductase [Propionibacteriaceae bacterium]
MRMTVVGGSRGTGAQVVRIAAEAGHQVTCLSRNGAPAPIGGVSYLTGDALNAEVAQAAVSGADAVVVSVGGATGSDRHRAEVTRSIIAAMRDAGVRRLIVHSSLGVGDSMQLMPAPARVFAKAVLGRALADHAEQEAAVADSGLDWTVVRPGGLSDDPATGAYVAQETAEGRPMKSRIPRADVAAYIVGILDDPATLGRALAMGTP